MARAGIAWLSGRTLVAAAFCITVSTFALAPTPARADGGNGGGVGGGSQGLGGANSSTGAGGAGGDAFNSRAGAGGGGAGTTTGGTGGTTPGFGGGEGGLGGAAFGAGGDPGTAGGTSAGGGGGGGGAAGLFSAGGTTTTTTLTGGAGGAGGVGNATGIGADAGGGGGGAGGNGGIVGSGTYTITGSGGAAGGAGGTGGAANAGGGSGITSGGNGGSGGTGALVGNGGMISNAGTLLGGNGGKGGNVINGSDTAGNGGNGGNAAFFGNGGSGMLSNTGTMTGGAGGNAGLLLGAGGTGGQGGRGGAGVVGAGITIINNGTIQGGMGGDGATRADAIMFMGGTNLLTGTGTVGSFTLTGGSTFAPGSGSAGSAMTVSGNLAFQSGAIYLIQVSPAAASFANVSGSATLAGSVQTVFAPGGYVFRQYTILHSSGLSGSFSGVSGNVAAGFAESLSYSATDVFLNLTAIVPTSGLSRNQSNVANTLNAFFNGGGTLPASFGPVFGLTGGNLGTALSQLSGEAATGAQQGAFQLGGQFLGIMLDPFVDGRGAGGSGPALGFAPEQPALTDEIARAYADVLKAPAMKASAFAARWSAWGGAYGGANRTSGDPAIVGSHDLNARAAGVAGGFDYRITPDTVVGFAVAGGGTNWSLAQGLGGGRSDAFQAGVYGATRSGPAYLAAALAYTEHWMSTDRFAFAGDHLTASFNAQSFGGRLEGGYRFATPLSGVTPYAALQAQSFRRPGYSETDVNGGGFGLAFNGRTATDTRAEVGARFDRVAAASRDWVFTLRSRLAWAHDWVDDPTLTPLFQALPGASFVVNGAAPANNSALASAGAELRFAGGVTLLAKFDGEFAAHASTYAGTGTLRYTW
jgi:uncharacterized protein with beta-barrel porin domain